MAERRRMNVITKQWFYIPGTFNAYSKEEMQYVCTAFYLYINLLLVFC